MICRCIYISDVSNRSMGGSDSYVDNTMISGFKTEIGFDMWGDQDCYKWSGMDITLPNGRPHLGQKF